MRIFIIAAALLSFASTALAQTAQGPSAEDILASDIAALAKRNAELSVLVNGLHRQNEDYRKQIDEMKNKKPGDEK